MNINLYIFESVDEIIPNLFISNIIHSKNSNNKYDLIINCTNKVLNISQKILQLPIEDDINQSVILLSYLPIILIMY